MSFTVGVLVGDIVGGSVGPSVGSDVGSAIGDNVGTSVGPVVTFTEGESVLLTFIVTGAFDGDTVMGSAIGPCIGTVRGVEVSAVESVMAFGVGCVVTLPSTVTFEVLLTAAPEAGSLRTSVKLLPGIVAFVGVIVGKKVAVGMKVVVGSKVGAGVTVGLNVDAELQVSPSSVLNGVIQSSSSFITVQ